MPMAIDFLIQGAILLGIIEVNENEHKVCWAPPGKDRPTDFTAAKGSERFLGLYKRVR
jgi:hypothetical protein